MHSLLSMRTCAHSFLFASLLGIGMAGPIGMGSAIAEEGWTVSGGFSGEQKKLKPADFKPSEDVSGMACDTAKEPWLCLVVDDETQGAQIVLVVGKNLIPGGFIRLIGDVFRNKPMELDAEAVTFHGGAFYVIASHGRPRHNDDEGRDEAWVDARVLASSHLFRIRFPDNSVNMVTGELADAEKNFPEVVESQPLGEALGCSAELAASMNTPLDDGGLTIEGLATDGASLFIGLRGPTPAGKAVILSVPIEALFGDAEMNCEIRTVGLGKDTRGEVRGVRDLLLLDDGKLLVLAGPMRDPPKPYKIQDADYAIYSLDGDTLDKRADLKPYGDEYKPEGMLLLGAPEDRPTHLLLLLDGAPNGLPTDLELN